MNVYLERICTRNDVVRKMDGVSQMVGDDCFAHRIGLSLGKALLIPVQQVPNVLTVTIQNKYISLIIYDLFQDLLGDNNVLIT